MQPIDELEAGTLVPPPPEPAPLPVATALSVALKWAAEQQLRPGNARGPTNTALAPVVRAWAEQRGLHGTDASSLGRALTRSGLRRRFEGAHGQQHLALHRDDAARLWRLVRAAWAPARAPGDHRGLRRTAKMRLPRRTPPRRKVRAPQAWAEALASLPPHHRRPLVDSLGRVWPCASWAAHVLGGHPGALNNAARWLQAALHGPGTNAAALRNAVAKGASWRGVWWRLLTPEELPAIPPTHPTGYPLPALRWGLVCNQCGTRPTPCAEVAP